MTRTANIDSQKGFVSDDDHQVWEADDLAGSVDNVAESECENQGMVSRNFHRVSHANRTTLMHGRRAVMP